MTKTWMLVAAVAGSACLGGFAMAGRRTPGQTVSITKITASGYMGAARNSADNDQELGCLINASVSVGTFVTCWARDQYGNSATCVNTEPSLEMLAAIGSITSSSAIRFEWTYPGPSGFTSPMCDVIQVANSSANELPR